MCRKNFENRFTNKNLTSKNRFEWGFLNGEIVSKGIHYFPGTIKSCKILLKMHKTYTKLKKKEAYQGSKCLNKVDKFARI